MSQHDLKTKAVSTLESHEPQGIWMIVARLSPRQAILITSDMYVLSVVEDDYGRF